jgi:hypothetical protein
MPRPPLNPSFSNLFFCRLSKAHAGATAILIYEFDASVFQASANGEVVRGGHGRFTIG